MSNKRPHRATSKAAHEFIKPHKPSHKEKILEALAIIRIGGTFEQIAKIAGMKDGQVWKRLSELKKDGKIFETGVTRPLSSSCNGSVWQLTEIPEISPVKTDKSKAIAKSIQQLNLYSQ